MISGVDEAGRGPVIGPMVVAGATFKNESDLIKLRVRDSKKLAPNTREKMAEKLKKIAIQYEIIVIPAKDIDDMRKVMTLNEIEVNAFIKIIRKLKPDICYVDSADVDEKRFGREISAAVFSKTEIVSRHKADDIYPVVGAASILAKTRRDEEVRNIAKTLEEKLGMPLGSGYPADVITQNFLKTWFEKYNNLPPHTRHSWKTAKTILEDKTIRKLDDFY